MNYTHIFWDFNGTLLDDVQAGIQSINVLLRRRGLPLIKDVEQYRDVFCFPIIKYYSRLGFDFTKENFADTAVEWVEQYDIFAADAPLYPHAKEVLVELRERGYRQIILTASEYNMVSAQLETLGIKEYFDEILGTDNIRAYGKAHIAVDYVKKARPERAVLIGDTEHDSEVAAACGMDCLLVSQGHQSRQVLDACGRRVVGGLDEALECVVGQ